jgi:hypothetical protein
MPDETIKRDIRAMRLVRSQSAVRDKITADQEHLEMLPVFGKPGYVRFYFGDYGGDPGFDISKRQRWPVFEVIVSWADVLAALTVLIAQAQDKPLPRDEIDRLSRSAQGAP